MFTVDNQGALFQRRLRFAGFNAPAGEALLAEGELLFSSGR